MSTLAQRCKQRREELNLSQQQLADASGRTQAAVGYIETGMTKHPRNPWALAKALQCNPFWLMFGESDDQEKETPADRG